MLGVPSLGTRCLTKYRWPLGYSGRYLALEQGGEEMASLG